MMLRGLITLLFTGFLLVVSGCSSAAEPELPDSHDTSSVAQKLTGSDGSSFLRAITSFEWSDDGRRAAETLAWVPADANSPDLKTAEQAGASAHAIATFLSSNPQSCTETSARNPELFGAYVKALIPYVGAMVGDPSDTAGFGPLDPLDGSMPATTKLFAAMACDAGDEFTTAASERASAYEEAFADFAAKNPTLDEPDDVRNYLYQAARLSGLISAGARTARVQADPTTVQTPYHVQYLLVSRMVHGSDPRISPEYFSSDGSLKSARELDGGSWSRYNGQLASYLTSYPQLDDAVNDFGRISSSIGKP
ncbi:hypothetical protein [Mycobacterium sp. E740]|uniref:hypothetical protein n=1 Tax=Mycobacterium sp. E740 TaxID=1834149 RepID=UPI000800A07D|nr:hypothetical protein [Mycobacterium sp. E740]OBI75160.1 hypothetical protein A5663_04830 [Mycobacterium sp. E740]